MPHIACLVGHPYGRPYITTSMFMDNNTCVEAGKMSGGILNMAGARVAYHVLWPARNSTSFTRYIGDCTARVHYNGEW